MSRHDEDFPVVPRRDRVHVLREFILETFDVDELSKGYLLDVAGGKGDFSFLSCNALTGNGVTLRSVVVDPRYTDHSKIASTAYWYATHPEERLEHAAQGHQLLPKLNLQPPFQAPFHLRMFFDDRLLEALRPHNQPKWSMFWQESCQRVEILDSTFKEHHKKKAPTANNEGGMVVEAHIIDSADQAWEIFQSTSLVIGFHPDEASDACVDFALERKLPFVVSPCCVFPSFFPHRRIFQSDGEPKSVSSYDDYIQYLRQKHAKMRMGRLKFASAAKGHGAGLTRNTVLYMLPCDYHSDDD